MGKPKREYALLRVFEEGFVIEMTSGYNDPLYITQKDYDDDERYDLQKAYLKPVGWLAALNDLALNGWRVIHVSDSEERVGMMFVLEKEVE